MVAALELQHHQSCCQWNCCGGGYWDDLREVEGVEEEQDWRVSEPGIVKAGVGQRTEVAALVWEVVVRSKRVGNLVQRSQ